MHRGILLMPLLLLASVEARRAFTSVIQPPDSFKGNLETFLESMKCDYSCEENEDDDLTEMLWLWREEDRCGVMCTIPSVLEPDVTNRPTGSPKPGSPELPTTNAPENPTNRPSSLVNGSSDNLVNETTKPPSGGLLKAR